MLQELKARAKAKSWDTVFKTMFGWEGNQVTGTLPKCVGDCELSFRDAATKNQVVFGSGVTLKDLKIVFKARNSTLVIGDETKLTGHFLVVGDDRKIEIGARTTMQGVYLLCRGADITIGPDCMFSREIEIRSSDVHRIYDRSTDERLNPAEDVVIEPGVWIGARAFVSKGARIPSGSIVGACSFVNKAFVEPNVIIAGTPARVVRTNIRWER